MCDRREFANTCDAGQERCECYDLATWILRRYGLLFIHVMYPLLVQVDLGDVSASKTTGFLLWGREWQHSLGMLRRGTAYHSSHPAPCDRMIESHASIPPSSQQNIRRVVDRTKGYRCVRSNARCTVPPRWWDDRNETVL